MIIHHNGGVRGITFFISAILVSVYLLHCFLVFTPCALNGAPLGIQDRRRVQVVVAKHCFALGRVVTQCDGRFMCAIPKHECRSSIRLRIPGVTRRNGLDQTFHLLGSPNGLIGKGAALGHASAQSKVKVKVLSWLVL